MTIRTMAAVANLSYRLVFSQQALALVAQGIIPRIALVGISIS